MVYTAQLAPSPVAAAFAGIQWDPLGKLRLTQTEKSLLRSAEENPLDYTLTDKNDAAAYIRALLKVLAESSGPSGPSSKVSHLRDPLPEPDALQLLYVDATGVVTHYAITRLYEVMACLRDKRDRCPVTLVTTCYIEIDGFLMDEWRPLLRILHLGGSGDPFAQRGAALCLAYILMAGCPSQRKQNSSIKINYSSVEEPLQALISWITSQLQSSSGASLSLVTPTLSALMSCPEARLIFASSGGIGYLSRHLRAKGAPRARRKQDAGASIQQLYELCFCLWTMTYECNSSVAVRAAFARDGAVKALVDLVLIAPREKVVRVALSALRNLAECSATASPDLSGRKVVDGSSFLIEMIGCGLIKSVSLMRERQCSDPDITEDLQTLNKLLRDNYKEMSRWNVYEAEVESGHLEWGILHTDTFFRENYNKLEGKNGNFYLLKLLVGLATSEDEDIAAIACFDIGEFVRFYPNGRAIANRIGAKEVVMRLIDHENANVQRHALQCVSKMLVQNWASLEECNHSRRHE